MFFESNDITLRHWSFSCVIGTKLACLVSDYTTRTRLITRTFELESVRLQVAGKSLARRLGELPFELDSAYIYRAVKSVSEQMSEIIAETAYDSLFLFPRTTDDMVPRSDVHWCVRHGQSVSRGRSRDTDSTLMTKALAGASLILSTRP